MHELGIAQSILEIVRQHVPDEELEKVQTVRLRLGNLSNVVPDSLDFCFSALIQGTRLGKARLEIQRIPSAALCRHCGSRQEIAGLVFRCPACGSADIHLVSGTELQVAEIDIAEKAAELP